MSKIFVITKKKKFNLMKNEEDSVVDIDTKEQELSTDSDSKVF